MKPFSKQASGGFTLVEMLVVIIIIGILAGIAGPSWLAWISRQRVNSAQAEALSALREAQANAKRDKREWQACFRDDGTKVTWSVQPLPVDGDGKCLNPGENSNVTAVWNNLSGQDSDFVRIDTDNTKLDKSSDGAYKVQFNAKGLVVTKTDEQITFQSRKDNKGSRRCIYVESILGALRVEQDDKCKS